MIELLDSGMNLAFLGFLASPLAGNIMGGLFGAAGGAGTLGAINSAQSSNASLPGMQGGQAVGGNFGQVSSGGQFTPGAGGLAAQGALEGAIPGMLGGGMFNDPSLQAALAQNDLSGALGQAQQGFGAQQGQFGGGLGALNTQLMGNIAGGPQDFSGGLQNQLFQQGAANQLAAGDQSTLFQQSLDNQRAAFMPQSNRDFNRLSNKLFGMGALGSTGGAEQMRAFAEAQNQADLNFQNNAFGQAMQQQNFLGNLGGQQIGQGQSFLGQNLGQFNQGVGNALNVNQAGFGQSLGSNQFNSQQGMNALNAAQGMFGLGADTFSQGFGQGIQGIGAMNQMNQFGLDAALSPFDVQSSLLGASGTHATANANLARAQAQATGGLFGGIGSSIKSIFSDSRLKDNLERIGSLGDLGWYKWDWNSEAYKVGANDEPNFGVIAQEVLEVSPEAVSEKEGYLQVDYSKIVGV